MTRRTKIVATLGPATDGDEALVALVDAGVDVVRLNLSHGSVERAPRPSRTRAGGRDHGRQADRRCWPTCPGRRSARERSPTPGVQLEAESVIRFETGDGPSNAELIRVDYPALLDDLAVGDRVVIGDGAIVRRGSSTSSRRRRSPWSRTADGHRAVPASTCPRSGRGSTTPTEEDLVLAETMAAAGVEFIAVSFVRAPADMTAVREVVGDRAQLVAKIETSAALGEPRRDPRRVRRDHGRAGRPRHRLPARGRAAPAEDDRPALRRVRRPGDHGDADAGVDDRRPRRRPAPRSATSPTPCSTAPMP